MFESTLPIRNLIHRKLRGVAMIFDKLIIITFTFGNYQGVKQTIKQY